MVTDAHKAWLGSAHARNFDGWARHSTRALKKVFESFNEVLLLIENKHAIRGRAFLEIGCATGELFRYMARFHPEFDYTGCDISAAAIERAKRKYPHAALFSCDGRISSIRAVCPTPPSVVFCRDVVHHQPDPYAFLSQLLALPTEAAILRVRTRDHGASVLDPAISCQYTYGEWVPYLVLNLDELIAATLRAAKVGKLILYRHYQQLGGHAGRFLPKDCYIPETGTAQTAMYVELSADPVTSPTVIVQDRADTNSRVGLLRKFVSEVRATIRSS